MELKRNIERGLYDIPMPAFPWYKIDSDGKAMCGDSDPLPKS